MNDVLVAAGGLPALGLLLGLLRYLDVLLDVVVGDRHVLLQDGFEVDSYEHPHYYGLVGSVLWL